MFKIMFYAGLALAIIFLVISIILFVRNNVAKLIGDVTGWNTKKAMKELHKKGVEEQTMNARSEVQEASVQKMEVSLEDEETILLPYDNEETTLLEEETPLLNEEETTLLAEEETVLLSEEETTLLVEEETTLLVDEETTLLSGGEETTLLFENEATSLLVGEETSLLTEEDTTLLEGEEIGDLSDDGAGFFEVVESVTVTHTEDRINTV